ncbi:MAG TPA: nucleotidyltransferase domain-containing protein [Pricia sp.]|nr:nucleotidyltransferase domain-containing protein [Pricia sp.]
MDIVSSVKQEVDKISENNEVILFGSRARGDFRYDSDWDFLILLKKKKLTKTEKNKLRDKLYEIELEADEVISTLIHSEQEWEKRSITPIYKAIKEEGVKA